MRSVGWKKKNKTLSAEIRKTAKAILTFFVKLATLEAGLLVQATETHKSLNVCKLINNLTNLKD